MDQDCVAFVVLNMNPDAYFDHEDMVVPIVGGKSGPFYWWRSTKKRLRQNMGCSKFCAKVSKLGTLVKQVLYRVGLGD